MEKNYQNCCFNYRKFVPLIIFASHLIYLDAFISECRLDFQ